MRGMQLRCLHFLKLQELQLGILSQTATLMGAVISLVQGSLQRKKKGKKTMADLSNQENQKRKECEDQGATGYWMPTRENAIRPLYHLLTMAKIKPDGIWEGD